MCKRPEFDRCVRPAVRRFVRRGALVVFALAVLGPRLAFAQTAAVTGLVTDPGDLAVPGATVSVTNTGTGVVRTTVSNEVGYYTVGLLTQGSYAVQVELTGFRSVRQSNLLLNDAQVLRLDVKLEVGGSQETIDVTATRPALDTETAAQSSVITAQTVVDLPLFGRNIMALAGLVAGVRPVSASALTLSAFGENQISISGGSPSVNNVMIDGIAAENHTSGGIMVPLSPDATEEFRIVTRGAPAEYGRTGGGIINTISKSGTNRFSGSAWEFFRNKALTWNDYFSIRNHSEKVPFRFHQYGATFGGPAIRNRTFFFANWEGVRQSTGTRAFFTVPTERERRGDFSQTVDANGRLLVIYDPQTTRPDPNTPGRFIRSPFEGNVIPAGRLNPVATAVAASYPAPNTPATATGQNNFLGEGSQETEKDLLGLRVDHYLTSSRRVFGRYTTDKSFIANPEYFGGGPADPGGSDSHYLRSSWVLNYSDAPSERLFVEARVGRNTFGIDRTPRSLGFDVTQIGLPGAINDLVQIQSYPRFDIADASSIGMNQGDPASQTNRAWTAAASATLVAGRHTFKAGGEFRRYEWDSVQGDGTFAFNFSRAFTNGPDPNAAATAGFGFASFLLGNPASGVIHRHPLPAYRTNFVGLFAQDDWKINPRLTLNLGLRWEYEAPTTDDHDALSNFDPAVATTVNGVTLTGGLIYPGANGLSRGMRESEWGNVGPRAGFAYQLRPTTVVRGSYGLFYLPTTGVYIRLSGTGFASQTAYVASTDGGLTPAGSLNDPFPQGIVEPSGSAQGPLTGLGTSILGDARDLTRGRSQQWDVDLQQQLWGHWALVVGYMGNRGSDLPATFTYGYLPESARALGTALQQLVPNPFFGLITTGTLAERNVTRATLLNTFPQFTGASGLRNWASSDYHAATVRLERRMSRGSVLASYTWSRLMDNNLGNGSNGFTEAGSNAVQNWDDLDAERAVSAGNQPHRLVLSANYALPFGRAGSTLYRAFAGGWQVNAIAQIISGNVIAVTANAPAFGGNRPNMTGEDPSLDNPTADMWLNRAAFANIPAFTFGDAPRNLPDTRTQALRNLDLSVFKDARFGAGARAQFRLEVYNVTNTTTLGNPVSNINAANFGQITSLRTGTAPRRIQLGVKLYF